MLVKNSAKNSTFVEKETSLNIILKVNFTVTLDVDFILARYFDILKGTIRQYEKTKKNL
jgi:hypothetical protein